MSSFPIPAVGEIIVLSMEYDPTGLQWVRLWDNHALGWLVSDALTLTVPEHASAHRQGKSERKPPGSETPPPETTGQHAPLPIILGSLTAAAPDTSPVMSPQWGKYDDPVVFLPDYGRMLLPDFLTWLATNNGARRKLGSALALSKPLHDGYEQWAVLNPELAFDGALPEPPVLLPVNTAVPFVSPMEAVVGDRLNCTMGEWTESPDTYSYQWLSDGEPVVGENANYTIQTSDLGQAITCVVTATNSAGQGTAPPSNAVTPTEAATRHAGARR